MLILHPETVLYGVKHNSGVTQTTHPHPQTHAVLWCACFPRVSHGRQPTPPTGTEARFADRPLYTPKCPTCTKGHPSLPRSSHTFELDPSPPAYICAGCHHQLRISRPAQAVIPHVNSCISSRRCAWVLAPSPKGVPQQHQSVSRSPKGVSRSRNSVSRSPKSVSRPSWEARCEKWEVMCER